MNVFERFSIAIRYAPGLRRCRILWNLIRPFYNKSLQVFARTGLSRNINGTDLINVHPSCRGVPEIYEPDVWNHLMSNMKDDDHFADVGAFVGLYTLAVAKRAGHGKVFAFEPSRANYSLLCANLTVNPQIRNVEVMNVAVGAEDGVVGLRENSIETRVTKDERSAPKVRLISLDTFFAEKKLDILKIDVEGFELEVIHGARALLGDRSRGPRLVYVEVHPFAWERPEVGSNLLKQLTEAGFVVRSIDGTELNTISAYGEIVAIRE